MKYQITALPVWRVLGVVVSVCAVVVAVRYWSTSASPTRTYDCNGTARTAQEIATQRQLSMEMYGALLTQFQTTPSELCRLSDDTLNKAQNVVNMQRAQRKDESLMGMWHELEAWVEGGESESEAEREGEGGEGQRVDPQYFIQRLQDENGNIPADGWRVAQAHIAKMNRGPSPREAGINKASWTALGPGNIGGRTRSIVVHPTDANILYTAGVSGGIWKSIDAGATWQPLNDFMANMAVSTMVMDPNNPNVLYAGTGEVSQMIQGDGIFKSTNAGVTWTQLASTANNKVTNYDKFRFVNKLIAVKNGSNTVLFAATWRGILKSSDGGATWSTTNVGTSVMTNSVMDIEVNPADPNKLVAGAYERDATYTRECGKTWYSTNAGSTWTLSTGIYASGSCVSQTVELAYAPSNPLIVYAAVDNASSGTIYKSTNGGVSYYSVNVLGHFDAGAGSQGNYDNILWVDPTNSNNLIAGGIDLWRSTNGGSTFTQISVWWNLPLSAHADQHAIVAATGFNGTTNNTVYFGNDGGIWKATNYKTVAYNSGWTEMNNTLGINQFYSVAGSQSGGYVIGGAQDNGTLQASVPVAHDSWNMVTGGDGGFVAIDPVTPARWYGEYVMLGGLCRFDPGASECIDINGAVWTYDSVSGWTQSWKSTPYVIDDAKNGNAIFIAPFILDPNNSNTMLAGGISLWRSTNVKAALTDTTGPEWYAIKPPIAGATSWDGISAIAVAPGNSDVIWVGDGNGSVWKTSNGTAAPGSVSWTQVDATIPNRAVTRIVVDANDNNVVYVTLGGFSPYLTYLTSPNIWKTSDGGTTWSPAAGSGATALPNLPVYALAIHPSHADWLYAGTELGIFTSEDAGATWKPTLDGPANVPVFDLQWMGTKLLAGTYGRGMFTSDTNNEPLPTETVTDTPSLTPTISNTSTRTPTSTRTSTSTRTYTRIHHAHQYIHAHQHAHGDEYIYSE